MSCKNVRSVAIPTCVLLYVFVQGRGEKGGGLSLAVLGWAWRIKVRVRIAFSNLCICCAGGHGLVKVNDFLRTFRLIINSHRYYVSAVDLDLRS